MFRIAVSKFFILIVLYISWKCQSHLWFFRNGIFQFSDIKSECNEIFLWGTSFLVLDVYLSHSSNTCKQSLSILPYSSRSWPFCRMTALRRSTSPSCQKMSPLKTLVVSPWSSLFLLHTSPSSKMDPQHNTCFVSWAWEPWKFWTRILCLPGQGTISGHSWWYSPTSPYPLCLHHTWKWDTRMGLHRRGCQRLFLALLLCRSLECASISKQGSYSLCACRTSTGRIPCKTRFCCLLLRMRSTVI